MEPKHLVCIEAKFISGNPLAVDKEVSDGEKPKSREGLIGRYIQDNKIWKIPVINADDLQGKVHSQLLRMIVFTSTIAQQIGREWVVANLISRTQWKNRTASGYDFGDPTAWIPQRVKNNFRFISWEDDIYKNILNGDPQLSELSRYMLEKTANLTRAFEL